MCFYADYDWIAQVFEESTPVADKPIRCEECGAGIPRGVKYHHVWMQQYDYCLTCELGECSCGKDTDGNLLCDGGCGKCECDPPNYGETSDWNCCENCHKFLNAVQLAEQEAGCDYSESRPPLGEMMTYIGDGAEEAKKYWKVAVKEYPELVANGYLAMLWRRMFSN